MDTKFEIFKGKSFQDLCKDIVVNQEQKKEQIEILIADLRSMIKNLDDIQVVAPFIKDYLSVGVTNNEHLVKLAQVVQRLMTAQSTVSDGDNSISLSEEEKNKLLKIAEEELASISNEIVIPVSKINK